MKKSTDRILTTHTGSLPRPPELISLMYQEAEEKNVDRAALTQLQTRAVEDAVARQCKAGIDIVSDGEMSKPGFCNYVTSRVSGFSGRAQPWSLDDLKEYPELLIAQYGGEAGAHIVVKNCTEALRYEGHAHVREDVERFNHALHACSAPEGFVPAISPGCVAMAFPNMHYDGYERYLMALAKELHHEYAAIIGAGLLLQIDCPDLPMGAHTSSWANAVNTFGYRKYLELHVAAINAAVEGLPKEKIRLHICWGNYTGPHQLDVPLSAVLPTVLEASVTGISFEAANPRHEHEWEDIESLHIPDDKILIPGVIDVKHNVLEHPRLVAQRIERFAKVVGRERVIAGTDCGFSTFVGFGAIHPSVAWLKLGSLAEGARLASKALWA